VTIAEGVEFDKIAREWRCKWSADDDKKSLVEAQKALESVLPDVKKVDGVISVERVVCGGGLDFKVVTTLPGKFWVATTGDAAIEQSGKFLAELCLTLRRLWIPLQADKFGAWEEKKFAPEEKFLEKLDGIDGVTFVETQTYTVRVLWCAARSLVRNAFCLVLNHSNLLCFFRPPSSENAGIEESNVIFRG